MLQHQSYFVVPWHTHPAATLLLLASWCCTGGLAKAVHNGKAGPATGSASSEEDDVSDEGAEEDSSGEDEDEDEEEEGSPAKRRIRGMECQQMAQLPWHQVRA